MMKSERKKRYNWRPFEGARTFVQALKFKNQEEWQVYCQSGDKPDDIPASPRRDYSQEFWGLGDWLGTRNIHKREWHPFEEARAYVRGLELKNWDAWRHYSRSNDKPDEVPSNPHRVIDLCTKDWKIGLAQRL